MATMQSRGRNLTPPLRIDRFRGINLSATPTQIEDNESPDMLNCTLDENMALNKRTGYEEIENLGGQINGMFTFNDKMYVASGTSLYEIGTTTTFSGLSGNPIHSFKLNEKMYILDGKLFKFDGLSLTEVTPYIPTLTISNNPTGGGTSYEDWNLLGRGFKELFSGNGTDKVYQLSLTNLDADNLIVKVNGVSTTAFTVDRVLGKVTFTTAPTTGTNNVEITAYKTIVGKKENILNATKPILFGGSQDSRVFVANQNYVYRSGLYDATYWPENGFYKFNDLVKGFSKQYDYLVVHLENGYRVINYNLVDGVASFPSKPINDQVGTIAPNSVQVIENNPVSLSEEGVYMLVASNVRDERNVQHLSERVDSKLLIEPNLHEAISVDYDRKYWLALNGNVYLFDYALNEWYIYDNIPATHFLEYNGYLCFGTLQGSIMRFKKETDQKPYNDNGTAIKAYWKSKQLFFGVDERMKLVEKVFYALKPNTRSSVDLYYISNKKKSDLIKTSRVDSFDFSDIDFSIFTFATSDFPQEVTNKIKAKKVTHFQLILENDKLDESMGILSTTIKFSYQGMVK